MFRCRHASRIATDSTPHESCAAETPYDTGELESRRLPTDASRLLLRMSVQMKKTRYSQAEVALARKSKKLAESQLRFTTPTRLAAAITDYIEWRAFAFWVRLIVDNEAGVSQDMKALLDKRCRGFLDDVEPYRRAHPREREFL